jgi:MFS family permease
LRRAAGNPTQRKSKVAAAGYWPDSQFRGPTRIALLVAASALRAALFPIPVITIFWKDQIGLSLADIMMLQAIFGATTVLLEFPSGYLADRVGYRSSLVIGAVFWIFGWTAYALGETFWMMAVAEVILGIGLAFTSGADSALLFVSLKQAGEVTQYAQWEGRVRAAAQASEALSSAVGGWFYSVAPRLPFGCRSQLLWRVWERSLSRASIGKRAASGRSS